LTASTRRHIFTYQQNNGEAEGTQSAAASETPSLWAIGSAVLMENKGLQRSGLQFRRFRLLSSGDNKEANMKNRIQKVIPRQLRDEEKILILHLVSMILSKTAKQYIIPDTVLGLPDGGMGSIQFVAAGRYGKDLVQVQYHDTDGQLVLITLVEGEDGRLFELEFWKTDFSSLCSYPRPAEVQALST